MRKTTTVVAAIAASGCVALGPAAEAASARDTGAPQRLTAAAAAPKVVEVDGDEAQTAKAWSCRNVYRSTAAGAWGSARICWRPYKKKGWYQVTVRGTLKDTKRDGHRAGMFLQYWKLHGKWQQKHTVRIGTAKHYGKVVSTSFSGSPLRSVAMKVCTMNRFNQTSKCSSYG
ncbi:hypothetical protein SMC26_29130 [Actinomadura fulvescens]|uniref:Secreted protein n=1 Tax=Actinomadura fulvescens TaxID=46160 RepID=A0ABP6C8Z7_9ACTN